MNIKYKKITEDILALAGVTINGNEPWDIKVHNNAFYERVITAGELEMGETYMAGWWDSESFDELIYRIIGALPGKKMKLTAPVQYKLTGIQSSIKTTRFYCRGETL